MCIILDNQEGWLQDLAATSYRFVRNADKCRDRCTAPFRAEIGEGLRIAAFHEGRGGKQVGGHDISLSPPAVYTDLDHSL